MLAYCWRYIKENSIRRFILCLYFFSSFVSLIKAFVDPGDYPINPIAIFYYICCTLILLYPIRKFGYLNCNNFLFPKKYINILSYILIAFGIISWFYIVPQIFTLQTIVNNMKDVRNAYYQGNALVETTSSPMILMSNWILYIQYLSPFLALYFYLHKKKIIAFLLCIMSLTPALSKMLIGEREATIVVMSNFIFAFLFWKPKLSHNQICFLKKASLILATPFIIYIVLMTFSRFSDENGVGDSIMVYVGEQPFNYSYFFTYINISDQKLGGLLNFPYLFPESQWLTEPLNTYISSSEFLNVFAAIPGAFLFDFGYYSIFIMFLLSFSFYFLIKSNSKIFLFNNFLAYIVYFQIIFMGVFYYDFTTKYAIIMSCLLYLTYLLWHYLNKNKHNQDKSFVSSNYVNK